MDPRNPVGGTERDLWRWRFGPAELDESRLELRFRSELVPMEPKPLEFLMCLLRHAGEVVTKDELLEALWTGRVVTESVLTTCVAKVRAALRDDKHELIRTVHGYGYRLVGEVTRDSLAGRRPFQPPRLEPGDAPPLRPLWRLVSAFDDSRGENWLAQHRKTGEKRVLKFAFDATQTSQLKREITVHRLLRETLGERDDIVHVLDWNLERPPYFIEFEHVPQGNLEDWLSRQGGASAVALAVRLALVAQVADALAAAHSAGVLHKDIKPANVLIDTDAEGGPRVRLADFGSGKILDGERLQALRITRMGFTHTAAESAEAWGTWTYLSPEAIAGQLPTARSDIFSLGVLLYQMIVGDLHRPLAPGWEREVSDELLREDIQACCDVDPMRRLGDAAALARRLRSLEPRRQELEEARMATARAEAMRIAHERGRSRRRWLAALAAVASIGFAVTLVLYIQVGRARAAAEAQAAAARSVNDYLVRDLLAAADPMHPVLPASAGGSARPDQVPVRELLDRAARRVGERFGGQPALEVAVRTSLGEAYSGVAAYREAAQQFLSARERVAAMVPADPLLEARLLHAAGAALREADDYDGSGANLEQALKRVTALSSGGEAERLRTEIRQTQAWLLYKKGSYLEAIRIMETEMPALEQAFGSQSEEAAIALTHLANTQLLAGQLKEAESMARRALALRTKLNGAEHPRLIEVHSTLADILRLVGRHAEAEQESRAAFELSGRLLGANHFNTLVAQGSLASVLQDAKRHDAAIALFEDAVQRCAATYGEVNYETTTLTNNLGLAYADAGRTEDAVTMLGRSLASGRALLGKDHPDVLMKEHNLADILADAGRWADASTLESGVLPRAVKAFGENHAYVALVRRTLGRINLHFRRWDEARANLLAARSVLVEEFGDDHPQVAKVKRLQAELDSTRGVGASAAVVR